MSRLSGIVAGGLVGILLLATTGIIVLAGLDKPSPDVLDNLAAGALGALAALLARVGNEPVQVTGESGKPVVVEDAGAVDVVYVLLVVFLVLVILVVLGVL